MKILRHEFVEFIPEELDQGVLYVSIDFCTVVHLCVCGCGNEVVTPLSPTDWRITFDGKSITLDPSIGNWSFQCRSHYFIRKDEIKWARNWSHEEIEEGRELDSERKKKFYSQTGDKDDPQG